jgi:ornithine decarboxylase
MLTDLQTIVDNCRRFSDAMPNVQLLYAVKAFCTSKVIRAVEHYIHGFDVASIGEIQLLIDNGIDASRLYYSNPVKSEHHCRQAYKLGVRKFAFQSKNELDKLRDISTDCVVYVRMDVGDTKSYVPLSDKFGCSEADAMDLLVYATQLGFQDDV